MDMNMQSKLLRVLQEKEVTRIGGHNLIKVNARLIVATNLNFEEEVENEDRESNRKRDQQSSQKNISKTSIKFFYHTVSIEKFGSS